MARKYLDDARYLLAAERLESAVSRAYYAIYRAMWAAPGDPPGGALCRHLGIISHFVRGYWFEPAHPRTGPGLAVEYNLMLVNLADAEECVNTATGAIGEVEQKTDGGSPRVLLTDGKKAWPKPLPSWSKGSTNRFLQSPRDPSHPMRILHLRSGSQRVWTALRWSMSRLMAT
jgi:hypothetical protein